MVLGQNILFILRRLLVWKVDSLWRSLSVVRQHSELYSRVDRTQLWYSLSLVLVLYWADFQTLFSLWSSRLGVGHRANNPVPVKKVCYGNSW